MHLADSLPVKGMDVRTFSIGYRGKNTTLRVELKKSDVDAIDIWFISQHELESEILKKSKDLQQ